MPLCSVSAQTSGSENVYATPYASSSAGHLRLAAEAGDTLRDVEDEIPALARHEPRRERTNVADPLDGMAQRFERAGDRIDRGLRVELGHGVLAEAERQIVFFQIVGEPDPHVPPPVARDRAGYGFLPSLPSGSGYRHSVPRKLRSSRSSPSRPSTASGQHRDLAAAARGVDDVVRHGVPRRVAAQLRDQLEAPLHGRAEVTRAADRIALVEVVRPDANRQQPVKQPLQRRGVVVHAAQAAPSGCRAGCRRRPGGRMPRRPPG